MQFLNRQIVLKTCNRFLSGVSAWNRQGLEHKLVWILVPPPSRKGKPSKALWNATTGQCPSMYKYFCPSETKEPSLNHSLPSYRRLSQSMPLKHTIPTAANRRHLSKSTSCSRRLTFNSHLLSSRFKIRRRTYLTSRTSPSFYTRLS